mgnify:CR=1 FL=1
MWTAKLKVLQNSSFILPETDKVAAYFLSVEPSRIFRMLLCSQTFSFQFSLSQSDTDMQLGEKEVKFISLDSYGVY